ncbi:MAG TPA: rhodanese-like domain-containing protein [Leucothrix mucor]|nr:rhodanese-like domain-containing protein [Leucothrix mucor]
MSKLISLSPNKSYELLQHDPLAILIDIRSSMEYLFVGHPSGAIHIAWIDEPDWDVNPDFVEEITQQAKRKAENKYLDVPVVLICRSGKRTQEAAKVLIDAGYSSVIHVDEGFEGERDEQYHRSTTGGWRYRGLPWEQC